MSHLFEGLQLVLTWPASGLMMLGVILGLGVGAVPGLGGIVGMSILLPFSFSMDPAPAFAFLLGMYAVTTTSDSLPAVLLGVPGTAAGAATVVDGYPMAQRGEATRALGAAFAVSGMGGVLGAIALAVTIPFVQPIILSFAPPEYFMLGVLGLTCVGALAGRSLLQGLIAALVGLLLSTIGYSTQGGIPRYFFGSSYLLAGLALVPVALGLFGVPEIVFLSTKNAPVAHFGESADRRRLMLRGIRDAFENWWLVVRCSLIGIYIGLLPGVGGAVADWVAYGHAVHSARDKSQFGKGDVRGVIAPEAANHSVKGSAMLPTIALGIPGTPGLAVMMGAFLVHGLRPGPDMLTTNISLTYSFIWTLVIANIVGAVLMMLWGNQLARITFVRGRLIVPFIMLFVFMGAWMARNDVGDWWTLLAFGVLGTLFKKSGWPRPPIILGFILGPIMETNLDLSVQALHWSWLGRPIVLVMLVALVALVGFAFAKMWRRRGQAPAFSVEGPETGHSGLSVLVAAVVLGTFVTGLLIARDWPWDAGFFPVSVTVPGVLLSAFVLARELRVWRRSEKVTGPSTLSAEAAVFLMFLVLIGITMLMGQIIAIPLVFVGYLLFISRERWTLAIGQALGAALILYFLFDQLLHVVWYPSLVEIL